MARIAKNWAHKRKSVGYVAACWLRQFHIPRSKAYKLALMLICALCPMQRNVVRFVAGDSAAT